MKKMFSKAPPAYAKNEHFVHLKKGFNIKLDGEAKSTIDTSVSVTRFAVSPYNFRGIAPIPKVLVAKGDTVKAGDVLFFDKTNPDVKYVSPVSGEIEDVTRGAKRSISNVIIIADKNQQRKSFDAPSLGGKREDLVAFLASSGAWTLFNQRPFDRLPALDDVPRDIFVTTFDTAPLAPDSNIIIEGNKAAFDKGIEVLSQLTTGDVHLGLNGNDKPNDIFAEAKAKKHYFAGKHPVGNVGIQIHHIKPIKLEDKVWTLGVQEVVTLGKLFTEGVYDATRIVAVTGAELNEAKYVKTYLGASIGELLAGNVKGDNVRVVSGDVLSGSKKEMDGFMDFRDDQITVLEEGNQFEFFGWLLALKPRPTASKSFPTFLSRNKKHRANTNTHGEERAFVVTGQYEKVLPMDIFPQYLFKSIVVEDFERMEGLGIAELTEEDVALCEFTCTSKCSLQKILRDGLEKIHDQL